MDMAFIKVLNMSISASWLVLAVLVLRLLLKKSPKWISVALWALVAVRLICPFSIESAVSLIPSTQTVPEDIFYMEPIQYDQNLTLEIVEPRPNVNPVEVELDKSVGVVQTWELKWSLLWPAGMVAMLSWALISYSRLRKKVAPSIDVGNGVYICDYIDTPFILGIVKPKIYLPSSLDPDAASHVLAHERSHIVRKDHWWKPFGYLLLSVHWFNPLLWLAYILLCRDIELACDEKVIRDMETYQKKAYSEAMLSCSVNRRQIAACPLAFGEVGVKERVKTVLNYKKPAFWLVLVAVIALIVTAVCFLTDPEKEENTAYRVEKVVYQNPVLSVYMTEADAPMFEITENDSLRLKEKGKEWEELGQLAEINLSGMNLDNLFFGGLGWEETLTLDWLSAENREAWILSVPPAEEANSFSFYLLLRQQDETVYLGEGIGFSGVYPLHKHILDTSLSVNWLYRLSETTGEDGLVSPYSWTSTLRTENVLFCAASLGVGDWAADSVEGTKLAELVALLNQVQEAQFVTKVPAGENDPLWNHNGVHLWMSSARDDHMLLRYVEDTLIISSTTDYGRPNSGYWVIENKKLKDWMQNLSYGGADMLSEDNREEIRRLLMMDYVEFFAPQEYDDYLFLGCRWDYDRGLGVAVFEKVAYGYKLIRLIRDGEVNHCASGSDLYYCDHNNRRIFLVMNEHVTGMEFAGAYERAHSIDTHPGLVVAYFPPSQAAMYRFVYGGGTGKTMYMDWGDQVHAQVPDYSLETFADPDDAYSVCSQLNPEQVYISMVSERVEVDQRYDQTYATWLTTKQWTRLLEMLNALPEDAYEPAAYPAESVRSVDIQFRNFTEEETGTGVLTLCLHEGAVFYQFAYDTVRPFQSWKIEDAELTAYLEGFFTGDLSTWEKFAPVPKMDGTIHFEVDGVEVNTVKVEVFEYEFTDMGLRFKPAGEESWVELQYHTEPLAASETGLKTFSSPFGTYGKETCVRGYYDESEYWRFTDVTVTTGDVVNHIYLINEDRAAWVVEYEDEISWMLLRLRIN